MLICFRSWFKRKHKTHWRQSLKNHISNATRRRPTFLCGRQDLREDISRDAWHNRSRNECNACVCVRFVGGESACTDAYPTRMQNAHKEEILISSRSQDTRREPSIPTRDWWKRVLHPYDAEQEHTSAQQTTKSAFVCQRWTQQRWLFASTRAPEQHQLLYLFEYVNQLHDKCDDTKHVRQSWNNWEDCAVGSIFHEIQWPCSRMRFWRNY